jgi:hypothetical protein
VKQEKRHLVGIITRLFATVTVACVVSGAAHAVPVSITLTSGSVGVGYLAPTPFASYTATGTIFDDISPTEFTITSETLSLSGAGPDTEMTLIAGVLSLAVGCGISDFGQAPFEGGVPAGNPGYVLNNSDGTGLLGDVFGSITIGGSFDAEGFGLAAALVHAPHKSLQAVSSGQRNSSASFSDGFIHPSVCRGRSLSMCATLSRCLWL